MAAHWNAADMEGLLDRIKCNQSGKGLTRSKSKTPITTIDYRIAFAIDYRGRNDDEPVYVFRGAPRWLLTQAFTYLVSNGNGIAEGFIINGEHDCKYRNGFGYRRLAVYLKQPNTNFASLDAQIVLIEAVLRQCARCDVTYMTLKQFLNV